MNENYKAKLLRQEIAGLERDESRLVDRVFDADKVLKRKYVQLRQTQQTLSKRREDLACIEAGETV